MLNFEKIEKIASELEEKLGITPDDAGDTLIDEAEEVIDATEGKTEDNLGVAIQQNVEEEKKNTEVPAESFAANTETASVEAPTEVEASDGEFFDAEDAKAFQASLKKLVKIAQTVKMSKDIPASKKEEVLARIQKASEKFINAVREDKKKVN